MFGFFEKRKHISGLAKDLKSHSVSMSDKQSKNIAKQMLDSKEDFEHLTPEGELPWGWLARYSYQCKPYEDKIVAMAVDSKTKKGNDRINALEELIEFYYGYKLFCRSKGECFMKYFSDQWEHCHNSRCKDFEYIKPYEDELKELKGQV